jgi:hypothetical protein
MYVCDFHSHLIRKITPNGTVTTMAGAAGVSGAINGVGSAARFNQSSRNTLDSSGNLYITDFYNNLIRKITPNGTVTTFDGSVRGYVDGVGTAASFNRPHGITIDSLGNLYVVEHNHLIRKITPNATVTTITGTSGSFGSSNGDVSAARFNFPSGIAIDSYGILYVSDTNNHLIRKATSSCIYSLFGNQICFSTGYLGTSRTLKSGDSTKCTELIFQTTTACCLREEMLFHCIRPRKNPF